MAQNNSNLYLLRYNNYYNRIVKIEPSLYGYLQYQEYGPLVCNFNPADGINTEHTFNLPYLANTPEADYLIVQSAETQEIVSRWFIVNATRTRGGQYTLTLHRDLIADYYEAVIKAPTFIERASLFVDNPFIWNSEGMNFNQIKKSEVLLKDESQSGWYVGYTALNTDEISVVVPDNTVISYPVPSISYPELAGLASTKLINAPDSYTINVRGRINQRQSYRYLSVNTLGTRGYGDLSTDYSDYNTNYNFSSSRTAEEDADALKTAIINNKTTIHTLADAHLAADTNAEIKSDDFLLAIENMNGNTYYDAAAGKLFTISLTKTRKSVSDKEITSGVLYDRIAELTKSNCQMIYVGLSKPDVYVYYGTSYYEYSINLIDQTTALGASLNIAASTKRLIDAPYKMFAIPAEAVTAKFTDREITPDPQQSKSLAMSLALALGQAESAGNLYDLQYLPFLPYRTTFDADGKLELNGSLEQLENDSVSILWDGETPVGYMLWCSESNFSFTINYNITLPTSAIDFKVAHETQFCRLVSPNYSGSFEFKPTSNRGLTGFEVNCTYKPFQPYIHINPIWNTDGLYGGDYNDQRGLVCGGEFSLPIVNSSWINYQIQNSAYKDAFDRQIENMEITNALNLKQQTTAGKIGIATAALSGFGAGAIPGSLGGIGLGLGVGAVMGAVGVAASSWGLQKDLEYTRAMQDEAMSYTKDQFNYNLRNIQALPYTLNRAGVFTINSKIFPFLEFYDCTPEEKEALKNKITYRGMTVGVIGTIEEYQQSEPTFIQGSLIRLEGIGEDYHCAAEIANEIHKGVYI